MEPRRVRRRRSQEESQRRPIPPPRTQASGCRDRRSEPPAEASPPSYVRCTGLAFPRTLKTAAEWLPRTVLNARIGSGSPLLWIPVPDGSDDELLVLNSKRSTRNPTTFGVRLKLCWVHGRHERDPSFTKLGRTRVELGDLDPGCHDDIRQAPDHRHCGTAEERGGRVSRSKLPSHRHSFSAGCNRRLGARYARKLSDIGVKLANQSREIAHLRSKSRNKPRLRLQAWGHPQSVRGTLTTSILCASRRPRASPSSSGRTTTVSQPLSRSSGVSLTAWL